MPVGDDNIENIDVEKWSLAGHTEKRIKYDRYKCNRGKNECEMIGLSNRQQV